MWKDLTDNVNSMASKPTGQVRNIAEVATAIADGDLSKKITVDVRGEILQLKETLNTMVEQLRSFAAEVTRVAREVGSDGRLAGRGAVAGTWKDLTDNVNSMASNLTGQVRNIAEVTTAVARGDLSRKITVDVKGEILELKDTINTMVDQLNAFASEVTRWRARSARKASWAARRRCRGWLAPGRISPTRSTRWPATSPGRCATLPKWPPPSPTATSPRRSPNVSGEILQLKETLNTMVEQLRSFAAEVTRVAREVGATDAWAGRPWCRGWPAPGRT